MIKAILFDFFGVLYVRRKLGFRQKYVPNEALIEFSQTLRPKYKVGMLTNMSTGVVDKYFTQEQLDAHFDNTIIAGDVQLVKPQPEMYELAAKVMKLEPSECLLVDDSQVNCEGARQAGMRALLYRSNDQIQQNLTELLQ